MLLGLGGLKLAILGFIVANTQQANHGHWNDLAVDYRYLAERLRALYYLPRAGSFQPPAAEAPRYALRLVRQSLVDWLFNAIARSVSPATLAQETAIPAHLWTCSTCYRPPSLMDCMASPPGCCSWRRSYRPPWRR